MTADLNRLQVACVGDSLTANGVTGGKTWPALVDVALFPRIGTANFGKSGNTAAQMATRYANSVEGQGYECVVFDGFVNSVYTGVSAAAIWATVEGMIDDAIADGCKVVITIAAGSKDFASWTLAFQAVFDALDVLIRAKVAAQPTEVFLADLTVMNDAADPDALAEEYNLTDGLHINAAGHARKAEVIAAAIELALPVDPEVEAVTIPHAPPRSPHVVKRGDLRPSLRMDLKSRDGTPLPLPDGATVRFRMRSTSAAVGVLKVDALAVIEDVAAGTVRYDWTGTDTDAVGTYFAEFRRVLANGQETVPGDAFLGITIIDPA